MIRNITPNVAGILLMGISVGFLAGVDTIVKLAASQGMHPLQIVFFRNFFGLIVLVPLLFHSGLTQLRTTAIRYHFLRGLIHSISMIAWFFSLTLIPLGEATALYSTIPIYVSVGAIMFMNESSQTRHWMAIFMGCIGMIIIVRPGFSEISFGSFLVILSAIAAAISKLMTKSLAQVDTPVTIVFYLFLSLTMISFIPATVVWIWPSFKIWFWFLLLGTGGTLAHVLQTYAYKISSVTSIEPVTYCRLIWASLFGFIFFSEIPQILVWVGTAFIAFGTIMLTHFEATKIRAASNQ